jgi:hypothetical protein
MNLVNELYNYFGEKEQGYKSEIDIFGPSSILACGRQLAYKKLGIVKPSPIDEPAILKMDMGSTIHIRILNILLSKGILKEIEKEGRKELFGLKWHYFVDGIGEDFIFELKTIYGAGFDAIKDKPKDEHLFQTLFYMMAEGKSKGIILYLGRDNGLLKQFEIGIKNTIPIELCLDFDSIEIDGILSSVIGKFNDAIRNLQKAREHIDKGTLPDAPFSITLKKRPDGSITDNFQKDNIKYRNPWQCSYCGYYNACKGQEIEEFSRSSATFLINGEKT